MGLQFGHARTGVSNIDHDTPPSTKLVRNLAGEGWGQIKATVTGH